MDDKEIEETLLAFLNKQVELITGDFGTMGMYLRSIVIKKKRYFFTSPSFNPCFFSYLFTANQVEKIEIVKDALPIIYTDLLDESPR